MQAILLQGVQQRQKRVVFLAPWHNGQNRLHTIASTLVQNCIKSAITKNKLLMKVIGF